MKSELFGKFKRYNFETKELTIGISFESPELLEEIEGMVLQQNVTKLSWISKYRKSKQYGQQKAWYGSLSLILNSQGIMVTKETMFIEDLEQRESIFPTMEYEYAGKTKYRPKRMNDCSFEEMQRNIEVLHRRHKHLKVNGVPIDFTNLKLK